MTLIYGEDVSRPRPISRLTWVAIVSDLVLLAYWVFIAWILGKPDDLPDWANTAGSSYDVLASFAVAFFASLVTIVVAIVGLARARTAGTRSNVIGVAALVAACLLNAGVVLPVIWSARGF